MKNDTLALISALALILALLASVTVLLVFRIITLDQVGPFLMVLVVPLTAIAGLPIFKAALAAPSPEQSQQLQQLHSQSIQALASAAQPAQVQPVHTIVPKDWIVNTQGNLAPSPQPATSMPTPEAEQPIIPFGYQPAQVVQQPFPPLTVPLAAMPKQ